MVSAITVQRAERASAQLSHGAFKTGRVYADFIVDGSSLSSRVPDLVDHISRLGWGSRPIQEAAVATLLLKGPADLPNNRRALYVCPECGDLGCGALTAVIERQGDEVVWRDFRLERDFEDEALPAQHLTELGPFRFRESEYVSAISAGFGLDGFQSNGSRSPRWWERLLSW